MTGCLPPPAPVAKARPRSTSNTRAPPTRCLPNRPGPRLITLSLGESLQSELSITSVASFGSRGDFVSCCRERPQCRSGRVSVSERHRGRSLHSHDPPHAFDLLDV